MAFHPNHRNATQRRLDAIDNALRVLIIEQSQQMGLQRSIALVNELEAAKKAEEYQSTTVYD